MELHRQAKTITERVAIIIAVVLSHASCENRCLPGGRCDLVRLRSFLADKNPDAAQRAAVALLRSIQSFDTFPDRGRQTATAGVRELIVPFGRSAYLLRYVHFANSDQVVVLRIWHGHEQRS